jgi:hypothetical protein
MKSLRGWEFDELEEKSAATKKTNFLSFHNKYLLILVQVTDNFIYVKGRGKVISINQKNKFKLLK